MNKFKFSDPFGAKCQSQVCLSTEFDCIELSLIKIRDWHTFSVKGHKVNVLGFVAI